MQNQVKRSATDIRIAVFKKYIVAKRLVRDEDMRTWLKCSRATYQREILDYLRSLNGLTHHVSLRLIGFEHDLDQLLKKQEMIKK